MPTITAVRKRNIIRVTATINDDDNARVVMSYFNRLAPHENFVMGPASAIDKKMVFDEDGLHALIFVGISDAEGAKIAVRLTDTEAGDEVVFDSGKVVFTDNIAKVQVWLLPG